MATRTLHVRAIGADRIQHYSHTSNGYFLNLWVSGLGYGQKKRTKTCGQRSSATWNDTFQFNLTNISASHLYFEVRNETMNESQSVGFGEVNLAGINQTNEDVSVEIFDDNNRSAGVVHLSIRFESQSDVPTIPQLPYCVKRATTPRSSKSRKNLWGDEDDSSAQQQQQQPSLDNQTSILNTNSTPNAATTLMEKRKQPSLPRMPKLQKELSETGRKLLNSIPHESDIFKLTSMDDQSQQSKGFFIRRAPPTPTSRVKDSPSNFFGDNKIATKADVHISETNSAEADEIRMLTNMGFAPEIATNAVRNSHSLLQAIEIADRETRRRASMPNNLQMTDSDTAQKIQKFVNMGFEQNAVENALKLYTLSDDIINYLSNEREKPTALKNQNSNDSKNINKNTEALPKEKQAQFEQLVAMGFSEVLAKQAVTQYNSIEEAVPNLLKQLSERVSKSVHSTAHEQKQEETSSSSSSSRPLQEEDELEQQNESTNELTLIPNVIFAQFVVPPDCAEGQKLLLTTQSGMQLQVTIPQNCGPGSTLSVQVPLPNDDVPNENREYVRVVIPEGATPGMQLRVTAPSGLIAIVNVPEGVDVGQSFRVRLE